MRSSLSLLLLALLLVGAASVAFTAGESHFDSELNPFWEEFKLTHKKHYDGQSEFVRRLIWESNVKYIQRHNLDFDLGKHSYSLGMNQFGDLTREEFRKAYLALRRTVRNTTATPTLDRSRFMRPLNVLDPLPDTVDWRTKGYVTPVKDQGECGSCWAFSTTGSMEGQYFRHTQSLVSFSEQQLVDCSSIYGNMGCDGGLMDQAFNYIFVAGLASEADYPYIGMISNCKMYKTKYVTKLVGYKDITQFSEAELQVAVATAGPVSVGIDAGNPSFQFYKDGVYNEPLCSSTSLDHGVLAVGYGTLNGLDYWLVKNSWGASWGQQGYILMSRNKNNQCGIATLASYPQL